MLSGSEAKSFFHLLQKGRESIEEEIGEPLEWRELAAGKESHIRLSKHHIDPANRLDWGRQHEWLREKLELFHKVFAPRIKTLKAEDYSSNYNNQPSPKPNAASLISSPEFTAPIKNQQLLKTVQSTRRSSLPWIVSGIAVLLIIGVVVTVLWSRRTNMGTNGVSDINATPTPMSGEANTPTTNTSANTANSVNNEVVNGATNENAGGRSKNQQTTTNGNPVSPSQVRVPPTAVTISTPIPGTRVTQPQMTTIATPVPGPRVTQPPPMIISTPTPDVTQRPPL
jgi:hypothetical protein